MSDGQESGGPVHISDTESHDIIFAKEQQSLEECSDSVLGEGLCDWVLVIGCFVDAEQGDQRALEKHLVNGGGCHRFRQFKLRA